MKNAFQYLTLAVLLALCMTACIKEEDTNPIDPVNQPDALSGKIDAPRTLANHANGIDYIVTGDLIVNAALTISPGVTIAFAQNAALDVRDNGTLNAVGTAAAPITFTGQEKTRGFWEGILVRGSNSLSNRLEYCTIEYAGNSSMSIDNIRAALIIGDEIDGPARIALRHVTIQQNNNSGMGIINGSTVEELVNCTFTNNAIPATVRGSAVQWLTNNNTFTGNTTDRIRWAYDGSISTDFSVHAIQVPYFFDENELRMSAPGIMRVEAGTKLILGAGCTFVAGSGSEINMQGTASQPITLEGESKQPGYYDGIYSLSGGKLNMQHVKMSDGGSAYSIAKAMVSHLSDGSLNVTNCVFSNYSQYGLSYEPNDPHNADIETSNTCTGTTGLGCFYQL